MKMLAGLECHDIQNSTKEKDVPVAKKMKEQAGGVTLNNSADVEKCVNEWQEEGKAGTWSK